jgi:hypothetical protein
MGDSNVIAGILQDKLYQYKLRTMIQEYLCNARDAHRENRNTSPFNVSLPTLINPVLTIEDFGPGLSPERLIEVFTKYGESTKRQDNKQTGGFGIGSKSGWAYTDQFTVISRYNGVKTIYSAHKGASKLGQLTELSSDNTDELNGVTIVVPIKSNDFNECQNAVARCLYFWKETEKPNVQGLNVQKQEYRSLKVNDVVTVNKNIPDILQTSMAQGIIVIDGIPYPLRYNRDNRFYQEILIVTVPTGLISVGANRESIDDTEQNQKILKTIFKKYETDAQSMIDGDYKKISSLSEVGAYLLKYLNIIDLDEKETNFKNFSTNFVLCAWNRVLNVSLNNGLYITAYHKSYSRNKAIKQKEVNELKSIHNIGTIYITSNKDRHDGKRIQQNYTNSTMYVIEHDHVALNDLKDVIGHDKFVDIETLPFNKPVRKVKTQQTLLDGEISLYPLYAGGKHQLNTTIQKCIDNKVVYVYMSMGYYYTHKDKLSNLISWMDFFKKTSSIKFITGPQKTLTSIQKAKQSCFIEFNEWFKSYTLTKSEIDHIKSISLTKEGVSHDAIAILSKLGLYILDWIFVKDNQFVSELILTKFKNGSKLDVTNDIKNIKSLWSTLPLLKEFKSNCLTTSIQTELLIYCDSKLNLNNKGAKNVAS